MKKFQHFDFITLFKKCKKKSNEGAIATYFKNGNSKLACNIFALLKGYAYLDAAAIFVYGLFSQKYSQLDKFIQIYIFYEVSIYTK